MIHALICELADYEKLRHEVDASVDDIARDLFGESPRVFAEIAEWNGEVAGFSLWFYNYSTFRAATASIWKTCSCVRRFAARASARRSS
jgi:hypothetical protein